MIGQLGRRRHGALRRLASRIKAVFDRVLIGTPPEIRLSSFRLLSRRVVDGMVQVRTPHPFLPALIFRISRDAVAVPVSHHPRPAGRSGYTPAKLLRVFGSLLLSGSAPLRLLVAGNQGGPPYVVRRRT